MTQRVLKRDARILQRDKVRSPCQLTEARRHSAQRPYSPTPSSSLSPNVNSLSAVCRLLIFSLLLFINLILDFRLFYENVK